MPHARAVGPVLLLASSVVVSSPHRVPGDPADALQGFADAGLATGSQEIVKSMWIELGLDDS